MRAKSILKMRLLALAAVAAVALIAPLKGWSQASPFRGLWVGSAGLNAVNEFASPLDENDDKISPDAAVPTPTFDRADLRLIIHVNGAGQVSLLKDVAILNRAYGQNTNGLAVFTGENDIALVTDPSLYSGFPPQPAMRYASAVFDFGDSKTTMALDAMVEKAANEAVAFTTNASLVLATQGDRVTARNDAIAIIEPLLTVIVDNADVATSFEQFIADFDTAALSAITNNTADPVVATLTASAEQIRDQSFYGDTRALDMVNVVVAAVTAASPADLFKAAHHTASSFADVKNLYQRFISSTTAGRMISASAVEAGTAAKQTAVTAAEIELAMRGIPETVGALTNALQAKVQMYSDTRSVDAVDTILTAMSESAFLNKALTSAEITLQSELAGRSALADMVARYPLPVLTPTADYNVFVGTNTFTATPATVAYAAADAAIAERATNPLYTPFSLYAAAKVAALDSLQTAYNLAARAMRTELPMTGVFAPGSGDPSPMMSLAQPADLGPAGLQARIYLPASHPTNPFRHRRHPDHTTGYNIERVIRLDFDGITGDSLEAAGYGVDRITGTYREEIFGLHKPLTAKSGETPVGLRTEGRFELNRVSFIDTLNTR